MGSCFQILPCMQIQFIVLYLILLLSVPYFLTHFLKRVKKYGTKGVLHNCGLFMRWWRRQLKSLNYVLYLCSSKCDSHLGASYQFYWGEWCGRRQLKSLWIELHKLKRWQVAYQTQYVFGGSFYSIIIHQNECKI